MPPSTYPGPSRRLDSVKRRGGAPTSLVGAASREEDDRICRAPRWAIRPSTVRASPPPPPACAPHASWVWVGCWVLALFCPACESAARDLGIALGSCGHRWLAQLARFQHVQHLPPSSSRTALLRSSSLVCLSPFSCLPCALAVASSSSSSPVSEAEAPKAISDLLHKRLFSATPPSDTRGYAQWCQQVSLRLVSAGALKSVTQSACLSVGRSVGSLPPLVLT